MLEHGLCYLLTSLGFVSFLFSFSFSFLQCSKEFATKQTLQFHQSIHSGEYLYRCDQCEKGFNCKSLHYEHTLTHTGEKIYESVLSSSFIKFGLTTPETIILDFSYIFFQMRPLPSQVLQPWHVLGTQETAHQRQALFLRVLQPIFHAQFSFGCSQTITHG